LANAPQATVSDLRQLSIKHAPLGIIRQKMIYLSNNA